MRVWLVKLDKKREISKLYTLDLVIRPTAGQDARLELFAIDDWVCQNNFHNNFTPQKVLEVSLWQNVS